MITVDDLVVRFTATTALAGVRLRADPCRVVGLIGPNGSGKSTLLRAIYGAVGQAGGAVLVDGEDVRRTRPRVLARRVAVVAQEEASDSPLTVRESVMLGRSVHVPDWRSYGPEDDEAVADALGVVGLLALADRPVTHLSGGERQRALIARALAQKAAHLLLDEPTNHLDVRYQHEVLALVRRLSLTTLLVLHDLNLAARYCDELVMLDHGRVVAAGPVDEVLEPTLVSSVYGIEVERVDHHGVVQLLLAPSPRA